jgi:hypothetical protein
LVNWSVEDKQEKAVQTAKERKAEFETELKWKQEQQERSKKFGAVRQKPHRNFGRTSGATQSTEHQHSSCKPRNKEKQLLLLKAILHNGMHG